MKKKTNEKLETTLLQIEKQKYSRCLAAVVDILQKPQRNSRAGEVHGRCIYLKLNVAASGLNKIILCQSDTD